MRKVLHILSQLTDEDVDWMSEAGERRRYEPGDILVRQGEPIDALMFLLDGKIGVEVDGVRTAIWGSGEMLGETSLVDGEPPSVTAAAIEPTHVLHIDGGVLHAKFDAEPDLAVRLYRAIEALQSMYPRSSDGSGAELDDDEIDMSLLDTVTVAGSRFDRMIKRLMTA